MAPRAVAPVVINYYHAGEICICTVAKHAETTVKRYHAVMSTLARNLPPAQIKQEVCFGQVYWLVSVKR